MIEVTHYQLWAMLLSTIRYSMGRMSGSAHECREFVGKFRSNLTKDNLWQIRAEVREQIQQVEATGGLLGHQMDHDAWKGLVEDLKDVV